MFIKTRSLKDIRYFPPDMPQNSNGYAVAKPPLFGVFANLASKAQCPHKWGIVLLVGEFPKPPAKNP
jgi:hypothetical protein